MWDKFTQRAYQVIRLAEEEAVRLKHPAIGTEHLLLGLIRENNGVAAKALANLGVNLENIRNEIIKLLGEGQEVVGEVTLTPRTKKVLELALEEARAMNVSYIGTEHILLGLIREKESVAARVLTNQGVSINKIRSLVLDILGHSSTGDGISFFFADPNNLNQFMPQNNTAKAERSKQASATPTLDEFGRDLTNYSRETKLDPVVGREKEIERVIQILSRRTKNNPILIGEPGVGKTAIAEGLAQSIIEKKVPETLLDKRVVTLDLSGVLAGTKYRGEFEERFKKIMDEIKQAGNVIIFIDEIHTLIGAGGAEGAIDAANILKPALSRGEIQCIGATTLDEYRKYIEKDAALERRFQPIMVGEPSKEEAIQILKGLRDRYEAHHRVKITDEAINAAVNLSTRYISDRFLPDKAIDLIDEAASRVRLSIYTAPTDLKDLESQLEEVRREKESAIHGQEFEKAADLRDKEKDLRTQLEESKTEWDTKKDIHNSEVTPKEIEKIVASWTGIPVEKLAQEESEKLLKLEQTLHERVIGQDEAVKAVSKAVRRARAGLKDPKRPIGSFIFLGPTGVGKTELARALAASLFGEEEALIRIDMSEYMEKHTVSRLIGAPPGYVGYEEAGQLTEAVRRKPYSVVLLDEIEKAHPEVFNILLQVLDDGRLTDSKGRTVDFRNTVFIMTSNVGASTIKREKTLGFKTGAGTDDGYEKMKDRVMEDLKRTFRPEFLNRIDELIVFHTLTKEHMTHIIDLMLDQLNVRLAEQELALEVTEVAKEKIIEKGFDEEYGARPLKRAIQSNLEDQLSEGIIEGKFAFGDKIMADVQEDKIVLIKKSQKA